MREMNRLGMIVDISHTSASTARDVLQYSLAPPIFSHSNAASIWNVSRNVPDDVLELVADRRRNKAGDGLVMATFAPQFVSQTEAGVGEKATLERVAGGSFGPLSDFGCTVHTEYQLTRAESRPYRISCEQSRARTRGHRIRLRRNPFHAKGARGRLEVSPPGASSFKLSAHWPPYAVHQRIQADLSVNHIVSSNCIRWQSCSEGAGPMKTSSAWRAQISYECLNG